MFGFSLKEKKIKLAGILAELTVYRYIVTKRSHSSLDRTKYAKLARDYSQLNKEIELMEGE